MFDGRDYRSVPLIAPAYYHPNAHGTADVLADVLRSAYAFARAGAMVGYQTYKQFLAQTKAYEDNDGAESATTTSPMTVSSWTTWIPGHATHARAWFLCRPLNIQPATLNLRAVVDDGTNTDTGDWGTEDVEGGRRTDPAVVSHRGGRGAPNQTGLAIVHGDVELDTVTLDGEVTFEVETALEDPDGNAEWLQPLLVVGAWAVIG